MQNCLTGRTVPHACDFPANIAVIIPAWQPRQELIDLVRTLQQQGCRAILVVDDGSDANYQPVFQQLQGMAGVCVLRHERNCGKGRALKTGLGNFLSNFTDCLGVVTADADGQHAADDIARVATTLVQQPGRMILGCRMQESVMPFRSRFGNGFTRYVFRIAAGVTLADTQTGLRGFSRELAAELLSIHGERYEYETAMLLHYCRSGRVPVEVPVRTIYEQGNRSSHFRPVRDSIRIYKLIAGDCIQRAPRLHGIAQEQVAPE